MRNAFLGLAVGIGAITAIALCGGIDGGRTVQAQEPDYSGLGDVVDFSGLDGLENLKPGPVEEPVASEPPAAAVEEPAPAVVDVVPVPVAPVLPVAVDVVALPATGNAGESGRLPSALAPALFALAALGTLVAACGWRRVVSGRTLPATSGASSVFRRGI